MSLSKYSSSIQPTYELYRLYNPSSGDHFYTTSSNERDSAIANSGYINEGIIGKIEQTETINNIPFYRLYNPSSGDHFYTTNKDESKSAIQNAGYIDEGIIGYVYDIFPFLELYSESTKDYFYTTNIDEKDNAKANYGYKYIGISGYIHTKKRDNPSCSNKDDFCTSIFFKCCSDSYPELVCSKFKCIEQCKYLRAACSTNDDCCSGLECEKRTRGSICVGKPGATCTTQQDCAGLQVCDYNNQCCKDELMGCLSTSECCAGLNCIAGSCVPESCNEINFNCNLNTDCCSGNCNEETKLCEAPQGGGEGDGDGGSGDGEGGDGGGTEDCGQLGDYCNASESGKRCCYNSFGPNLVCSSSICCFKQASCSSNSECCPGYECRQAITDGKKYCLEKLARKDKVNGKYMEIGVFYEDENNLNCSSINVSSFDSNLYEFNEVKNLLDKGYALKVFDDEAIISEYDFEIPYDFVDYGPNCFTDDLFDFSKCSQVPPHEIISIPCYKYASEISVSTISSYGEGGKLCSVDVTGKC